MAIQNFVSSNVQANEVVKAVDIQFGFESVIGNVTRLAQMILESTKNFVINGKVFAAGGMNIQVEPIFGVCKETGEAFGCTSISPIGSDGTVSYISIERSSGLDRIDILEARAIEEQYDTQQRLFRDFDTNTDTLQSVDTKKRINVEYKVVTGVSGSVTAPDVEQGWVKLAEIKIAGTATEITDDDIYNITTDVADEENSNWTNDKDSVYNIGYISDVNRRFRAEHKEDGTHKDNIIGTDELDIGNGNKQINANVLPTGGEIEVEDVKASATTSIFTNLSKITTAIKKIYTNYVRLGYYQFNGEIAISDILNDDNSKLDKALKIGTGTSESDGRYIYITLNGIEILKIMSNGVIRATDTYEAKKNYDLVTKKITDSLKNELDTLDTRISYIENNLDPTASSNKVFSKFRFADLSVIAATTTNIELSGSQIVDGVVLSAGDMVLVKNQTEAKDNGIYEVNVTNDWRRNGNYISSDSLGTTFFEIQKGTVNEGKLFFTLKDSFRVKSESETGDDIDFIEFIGSKKNIGNKIAVRDATGHVQSKPSSSPNDCVIKSDLLNLIYPVGSLYWSSNSTNPSQLFGGTWTQIKDKFVLATGDTYTAEATGGNASITLTESQLPSHNHSLNNHAHSMRHTHGTDTQGSHTHNVLVYSGSKASISNVYAYSALASNIGLTSSLTYAQNASYMSSDGITKQYLQNAGSHSHTTNSQSTSTTGGCTPNITGNTGSGSSITILPPYVVKYCWERIA